MVFKCLPSPPHTRFAWKNYHRYAWGHDHLKPLSRRYDDDLLGLGATLIDSLTGLLLMDLKEEYRLSLVGVLREGGRWSIKINGITVVVHF